MKKKNTHTRKKKKKVEKEPKRNRCVRYSDNEWAEVHRLAAEAKMTPAAYVRAATLRPLRAPRVASSTGPEIVRQLRKIGINLNQLTRSANIGKPLIDETRASLSLINDTVKDIIS